MRVCLHVKTHAPRIHNHIYTYQHNWRQPCGDGGVGCDDGGAGVVEWVVMMTVVLVVVVAMLMMPDDRQGPGIGQSYIIFAFSAITKNA